MRPAAYPRLMLKFALIAALAFAPATLRAESLSQAEIITADILPGWQMEGGRHMAALRLRMAPEWKTYWRSPGDAGIPPEFDWSGSRNVRSVQFHWPRPKVFHTNGMQSIGYYHELVLPVEVTPIDPSKPIFLRASMDLGVCRDICVPAAVTMGADLSSQGAPDAAIDAALRARPATQREAGVKSITCEVEPIDDGLRITTRIEMPPQGNEEVVVMEAGSDIWASEAVTRRQGSHLTSTVEMVAPSGEPFALNRSAMTLTVLGNDRAVEISGCPSR